MCTGKKERRESVTRKGAGEGEHTTAAKRVGVRGCHRRDDASTAEKLSVIGRPCRLGSLPRRTAPVVDEVADDSAPAALPISAASPGDAAEMAPAPAPPPPLPLSAAPARTLIRQVGHVAFTRSHSSTHCKHKCKR